MPSQKTAIYFDGYCPQCKLHGKIVETSLNSQDFYECKSCHLQFTTFPPYTAILNWKGQGEFRSQSPRAYKLFEKGLLLTRAKTEHGQEIFPDENAVIKDVNELVSVLAQIKS